MSSALARSFGRAAARYREHAQVQDAMAEWLAEWLPADRAGRALELGAGPAVFTERALPWRGTFVATDVSAAMCREGRARVPTIDWRTMPAEAPAGGPWDWMLSASMLQWIADPMRVLLRWREQLAPGGRVLAGLFTAGTLTEVDALLGRDAPIRWRSRAEWRRAIGDAGLRLIRDEEQSRVYTYESALALWRALHGVGAVPERRLTPAQLRRVLRQFDARHTSAAGARVTWMFYRFEAATVE